MLFLALLLAGASAAHTDLRTMLGEWTVDGERPIQPDYEQLPAEQAREFCDARPYDGCLDAATAALTDARQLFVMVEHQAHEVNLASYGVVVRDITGHTGLVFNKTRAIVQAVARPHVRTYCEIGFNAGHSALTALFANPRLRVISFELGMPYTAAAVGCAHRRVGGERLEVVLGDSAVTVPAYAENHPDVRCDVLLVDGGHSEAQTVADIRNMAALAAPGGAVLLLDDTNTPEVASASSSAPALAAVVWDRVVDGHVCSELPLPVRGQGFGVPHESCFFATSMMVGRYLPSS